MGGGEFIIASLKDINGWTKLSPLASKLLVIEPKQISDPELEKQQFEDFKQAKARSMTRSCHMSGVTV